MGLDPVNALTGAFLWSYTFLEDYGKDVLQFTLMYDSQRQDNRKALGRGWSHSLNYLLSIDSKNMYFSMPYDEVVPFYIYEDGSFQPVVQTKFCLQRKEQSYVVSAMDGTEYIFDSNLILSQIVENGLTTCSFSSDAEGKIIRIEGRYGAALTLAWSGGHISRVSDALGNAVTYAYDGDLLISATGPDGSGMSFAYDAAGKLTEIMDFSGSCYLGNEYDEYGRVMSQSTAGRGESLVSYDEENKVTTFTDELGNETKYHYDEEMHVTSVELAGCSMQNKYDADGRLSEQMDGLGNMTKMAYDECGRMNCVTNPDGTEDRIIYNDRNYPVRIVNSDGTESQYGYDEHNNLITEKDERGNICSYVYECDNIGLNQKTLI